MPSPLFILTQRSPGQHRSLPTPISTRALPSLAAAFLLVFFAAGCRTCPIPGALAPRRGDEMVVAGQFIHTGTRVVLWLDPGGYDAYRTERRFVAPEEADWEHSRLANPELKTPNRYGQRWDRLSAEEAETIRRSGWTRSALTKVVDQLVIHFDASGTSRQCFKVLQDRRGLSVHFMLDLDGTLYQTLDLKERAWHATTSNGRSIGIEIANIGAYPAVTNGLPAPLADWYRSDTVGKTRLVPPAGLSDSGLRRTNLVLRPIRPRPITGVVQGKTLVQYDFTRQQYAALGRLTAALCRVFPHLRADYPRDVEGNLLTEKLPEDRLQAYQGILGHYHIQTNKVDPGPAFQWERLLRDARRGLKR